MIKQFVGMVWGFYGLPFPIVLAEQLKKHKYKIGDYFAWFWTTSRFRRTTKKLDKTQILFLIDYFILFALMVWLIVLLFMAGRWQIAGILIILNPFLLIHLTALPVAIFKLAILLSYPKRISGHFKKKSKKVK